MEKNATSETMIIKAERPAAATAAAITVDVDPEALNCPKCLRPFEPPVFQVYTYVAFLRSISPPT